MRRRNWLISSTIFTLVVLFAGFGVAEPDSTKSPHPPMGMMPSSPPTNPTDTITGPVDSTYRFVLDVRHRVFASFKEIDTVCLHERFSIGEGEYEGQVFLFNPHLLITDKGEYLRGSDSLFNPAVRIRLFKGDSVVQRNWAFFYSEAPHFRRNDLLGFKLVSYDIPDIYIKVEGSQPGGSPAPDSTKKEK